MGQFNNKVKVEVLKDFLAKNNGVVQVQDLFVALGSKPKRVRCAVHWTRRTGTPLFAIREAEPGKRGAGKIVAYSTTPPAAVEVPVKAPKVKTAKSVKAPKATKPAKVKASKAAVAEAAPAVAETVAKVEAAAKPAPKTMSLDQVRAALAARKPKVA